MTTIWKYAIPHDTRFDLEMPQDARILCVQVQDGTPCIWAQVNSDDGQETRQFTIVGTGHAVPPGTQYVATWQDVPYVWHLYERVA